MGLLLRNFDAAKCCLCGNAGVLTGEHKIKLSALRDEFGNVPLYIGQFNDPDNLPRLAQSPKSKYFHFTGKICSECNGSRTQEPDRCFHEYHLLVKDSIQNCRNEFWDSGVFIHPDFGTETEKMRTLFRYFSKILCCRRAESNGPTPVYLAQHAIGEFQQNRVWLQVRKDPIQELFEEHHGAWPYAAHGGLILYSSKEDGGPTAFHSTITIGPVQYIFWFRLHWLERWELRLLHREFYQFCKTKAADMRNLPVDEMQMKALGLS